MGLSFKKRATSIELGEKLMAGRITVLLPFHRIDFFLRQAIESCERALDSNSVLLLINTSFEDYFYCSRKVEIRFLNIPGASYLEALRSGLMVCETELVALMNSDDQVDVNKFQIQKALLLNGSFDLVHTAIQKFRGTNSKAFSLLGEIPHSGYNSRLLLLGSYGANATWLFRKDWAWDIELFGHEEDKSDWSVALRTFPESRIGYINQPLYMYRMHRDQVTRRNPESHLSLETTWTNLNNKLSLPNLSNLDIRFLTMPNRESLGEISLPRLNLWIEEFRKLNRDNKSEFDELLQRRALVARIFHGEKLAIKIPMKLVIQVVTELVKNRSLPRG